MINLSKYPDDQISKLYELALNSSALKSRLMIAEALTCKEYLDDQLAISIFSEVYGFSAKKMGVAVQRHPEYFPDPNKTPDEALPTPDQIIALRNLAQLSVEKEPSLFEEWKDTNMPAWMIFERVQQMNRRRPRHSKQKLVIKLGDVRHSKSKVLVKVLSEERLDGIDGEAEVRLYKPTKEKE